MYNIGYFMETGLGVGVMLFDEQNRLFLGLRGPAAKNERNLWMLPGGTVDPGQRFQETVHREVMEELGVKIQLLRRLSVYRYQIPQDDGIREWVSKTYIARITEGEVQNLEPHKCADLGWFTIEEAKAKPLSVVTRYDINQLQLKYPEGFSIKSI